MEISNKSAIGKGILNDYQIDKTSALTTKTHCKFINRAPTELCYSAYLKNFWNYARKSVNASLGSASKLKFYFYLLK